MTAIPPPPVPNYGIDSDRLLARDPVPAALRRRWDGRYAVDEFGGDPHLQDFLLAPLVGRLPVRVEGAPHLPATGGALLVANLGLGLLEPLLLAGVVQRTVGRRLRLVGLPGPLGLPGVGALVHKLGGVGRRAGDVAAVLRAGHLAAAPLGRTLLPWAAGEAPRPVIGATLGYPVLPVAVRPVGPVGLPVRGWVVAVGPPCHPPADTAPDDPLAAAELAEEVRGAVAAMLRGDDGDARDGDARNGDARNGDARDGDARDEEVR